MRFVSKLFAAAALLFAAVPPSPAQTTPNYTTKITLANLLSGGVATPYAKVCAVPADAYNNPISVSAATWGLVLPSPGLCANVVAGALPSAGLPVPDANHTNSATPIRYNISIQLTTASGLPTGAPVQFNGVLNVTGPTYALDTYTPTVVAATPLSNTVGSGSGVPASCTAPSLWLATDTSTGYLCKAGSYVPLIGGAQSGPAGANGVASLPALAGVFAKLPLGQNFFIPANATNGFTVSYQDGNLYAAAGFIASDFLPANSGGTMSTSLPVFASGPYGIAFYDQNKAYISGIPIVSGNQSAGPYIAVAAGGNFPVPATAAFVRVSYQVTDVSANMVVWGSTLPPSFVAAGSYPPNVVDSKIAAVTSGVSTQVQASARQTLAAVQQQPIAPNLYDPAKISNNNTVNCANGTLFAVNGFITTNYIPVIPGGVITSAYVPFVVNSFGVAFYNGAKVSVDANAGCAIAGYNNSTPIPGFTGGTQNASTLASGGVQIPVPADASFLRLSYQAAAVPNNMISWGSTLPSSFIPYGVVPGTLPLAGKKLFIFGDSYCATYGYAWIPNLLAATGLTLQGQACAGGRPIQHIFDDFPAGAQTTLQQITAALANADIVLLEYGANDGLNNAAVGAPGDSTTAATEYGYYHAALDTIFQAKPTAKVMGVGPIQYKCYVTNCPAYTQWQGITPAIMATYVPAWTYEYASYGAPFLNLSAVSNINQWNVDGYTRDGVHFTDAAYAGLYAPLLARFMTNNISPF